MDKFISIIKVVLRKWIVWMVFPILSMALVYFLTKGLPKTYSSNSTIHVNLQTNSDLSLTGQAVKQYEIGMYFQNLQQLLKARSVFEYVRLNALKSYLEGKHTLFEENIEGTQKNLILNTIEYCLVNKKPLDVFNDEHKIIIEILKNNGLTYKALGGMVSGVRLGASYFFRIKVKTDGAYKAKYFADLFSEALIANHVELSKESIRKDREMIEELVRQAKLKLDKKVRELEDFKIKNNIINLGELTKAIVNQTVDMEIALAKMEEAEAANIRGMREVENIFKQKGKPLPITLESSQEVIAMKEQLRKMNQDMLNNKFTTNNLNENNTNLLESASALKKELYQNIKQTIVDAPYDPKTTRQNLVSRYIGLQLDAEMAKETKPLVKAEIRRLKEYTNSFAPLESAIGTFDREIHTAEQSYLILLNKLNLTKTVEKGTGANELTINDEAYYPEKPEPSKRAIMILGAGVAVFIMIVAVIVVIELLDLSITTVKDFEGTSQIPLMAAFPNTKDKRIEEDSLLGKSMQLVAREQFKVLREKVLDTKKGENIFLFTSTYEKEGKSWIVNSLAEKLIKNNHKVLVIHADWFNKETTNFKSKLEKLGTSYSDLKTIHNSGLLNLSNADTSLFDSYSKDEANQVFNRLKETYDYIFIITPPASFCSDWQEWASFGNHIIQTFKANKTYRSTDKRIEQRLLDSKVNVMGSIFNKVYIENMEGYVGEIPKKRTRLRKVIKKWAYGNFQKS